MSLSAQETNILNPPRELTPDDPCGTDWETLQKHRSYDYFWAWRKFVLDMHRERDTMPAYSKLPDPEAELYYTPKAGRELKKLREAYQNDYKEKRLIPVDYIEIHHWPSLDDVEWRKTFKNTTIDTRAQYDLYYANTECFEEWRNHEPSELVEHMETKKGKKEQSTGHAQLPLVIKAEEVKQEPS